MFSIKNIATTVAIAAAFFAASVNVNAQRMLIDRADAQSDSARTAWVRSTDTGQKQLYADTAPITDGNTTVPMTGVSKVKAYQGVSFGIEAGGEYYDGNFSPLGGGFVKIERRGMALDISAKIGIGHQDKLSDSKKKYPAIDFRGAWEFEVYKSKSLQSQLLIGPYIGVKNMRDLQVIEKENVFYFDDDDWFQAVGGGLQVEFISCRSWSSCYFSVVAFGGIRQSLHANRQQVDNTTTVGGTKLRPEFGLTLRLGISAHKKHYNVDMTKSGYNPQWIERSAGLRK